MKQILIDWKEYSDETTSDLIEYMRWKDQDGYRDVATAAFTVFVFRFREELTKKCEIVCDRWGYDKDVTINIVSNTFKRFWKYPMFSEGKSKASNYDRGVLIYLLGIANRELINYYNREQGNYTSPYTGDEVIIREYPEIDFEDYKPERRTEMRKRFEIIEKALARLTEKHKIIYLTYQAYEHEGHNLPSHLLKSLRKELKIAQSTIRYYKFEAIQKIEEYLEIYG